MMKNDLRAVLLGMAALSAVRLFAGCIDFVDPFIGTEYSGDVFLGPTRPFGLMQPGPDTNHGSGRYAAGYKHLDETVYGFSQTHLSGMGCGDLGDVLLSD